MESSALPGVPIGSLAAVSNNTGLVRFAADFGIATGYVSNAQRQSQFWEDIFAELTIFICKIQVTIEGAIVVEGWLVAASFCSENAIVDDLVLQRCLVSALRCHCSSSKMSYLHCDKTTSCCPPVCFDKSLQRPGWAVHGLPIQRVIVGI